MNGKHFDRYKGIGLPRSPGFHSKYLDALSHSTSAFLKIIRGKYNVIYINSIGLSTLAWLPKIMGQKVVVHTHGLDWKREKWGPVAKKFIRMSALSSAKLPHATFCVCLEDKRFFKNNYGKRCQYIPNGVPGVKHRQPHEILRWGLSKNNYLLFMARLVPEKGAHFLVQAWQNIPQTLKLDKKLVIAGDSNHRDQYYFKLKKYARYADIIFTGFATDALKQELLSNALCFLQPSTVEGMPLSVLEAMGYGCMIIASDIQENKDVLSEHGWTFRNRNVDDLAKKLSRILSIDTDIVERKGLELRNFVTKNYNWDRIVDTVEEHLTNLVLENYN
jgi:glycosyltransferase involved in cell wall biosynthesis